MKSSPVHIVSCDVEDWFNILDTPAAPPLKQWGNLPSIVEKGMDIILQTLADNHTYATFFWLGWFAERYPKLLKRCSEAGHEIACHGYEHLLAFKTDREIFRQDILHGKRVIENITGKKVLGFRAAGFSVTEQCEWFFDILQEAGYIYDSSIFPAHRAHGGMKYARRDPHWKTTSGGKIFLFPQSVLEFGRFRFSVFGGGYLRLAPQSVIHWGCEKLDREGVPVLLYLHPREVIPGHPRLPLSWYRSFKCYVNLDTTVKKLQTFCQSSPTVTIEKYLKMIEHTPEDVTRA